LALNGYIQLLLVIALWNMNKKKLRMECVNFSGGGSLIGPISRMATISIRLKLLPSLEITPDIPWIKKPVLNPNEDSLILVGVRARIAF
jgi:hypothetical protein